MSLKHSRNRTLGAQIDRMRGLWPDFACAHLGDEVRWRGVLRPLQRPYLIEVQWAPQLFDRPLVRLINPALAPRHVESFESIPHLIFCRERPEQSAMCLFDPDGARWMQTMWIADTTMPWAARWLYYYELWHYDGIWRAGGVGPTTIAELRAQTIETPSPPNAPPQPSVGHG